LQKRADFAVFPRKRENDELPGGTEVDDKKVRFCQRGMALIFSLNKIDRNGDPLLRSTIFSLGSEGNGRG
jgi:hypothetical protein